MPRELVSEVHQTDKAKRMLRTPWSRLHVLTALSALTMAQACATEADDPEQAELAEYQQALGEEDGAITPADGGGATSGGATTGGLLGGVLGGTTGGLLGGFGGTTGGFIAGLGGTGGLLGGFGGGAGGTVGGIDAGELDGGPADSGIDGSRPPPLDGGGPPPPPIDGGIIGGIGGLLGGDGGIPGGVGGPVTFAHYKLDDCGPSSVLLDSSPSQAHAQRSAQVACAQGISGGAVLMDAKKDTITTPPNPAFDLSGRVAVAAWIHPTNVTAKGNIVSKDSAGTSAFELFLNNGNLVFRIDIDNGTRIRQVTSRAPIAANRWSHVAGMYDGSFVRLFVDGQQVGQIAATGTIADVDGGLQIGNNLANNFLRGRIDEVWLSSAAVTPGDIANLSCIRGGVTVTTTPRTSGPVDPGVTFTYDIAVANKDVGACQARNVNAFANFIPGGGISANVVPSFANLPPGTTTHLSLQVTGSEDADPGAVQIPFNVFSFPDLFHSDSVEFVLKEPTGCFVRTGRELFIRDLSVVEDPLRTTFDGPVEDPRTGAWTFGRLMEQIAPSDAEAPDMVEHMLRSWLSDQTINSFAVPNKPLMQNLLLDIWPRSANGKLDLTQAPVRLLAIVNRIDSRNLAQGHAGEGRFVFGVLDAFGFPTEFTMIFEYRLPAKTTDDVVAWANAWHALGALPFPSEEYNAALQAITDRFAGRGAEPARPNDSALAQFRTNEFTLSNFVRWELREFELSATTHRLEPATVKLTPDTNFIRGSQLVADYVNQNESSILVEQHVVPEVFQGQNFLGGSSFNDLNAWVAPGINNNEARHKFSLNTCNGCHAAEENGTFFLHVNPRDVGQVSELSGFMTGTSVPDPVTRIPRSFHDLGRRNADLKQIVCPAPAPVPAPTRTARTGATTSSASTREAFLSKGIGRTH